MVRLGLTKLNFIVLLLYIVCFFFFAIIDTVEI
jgi:hypothetical protein